MGPQNHRVPLVESQHHVIDATNSGGAFGNGVEDRLHVRGRAADDAEHFGGCGLMLQGLAQFRIALLKFLEQPHVLDGDHGLVGEGLNELNLPFRKRFDKVAPDRDRSDLCTSRNSGTIIIVRAWACEPESERLPPIERQGRARPSSRAVRGCSSSPDAVARAVD